MRTLTTATMTLAAFIITPMTIGQSNVSEDNKLAWGENIGWTNWRDADGGDAGVVFTDLNLPIVPVGDPVAYLSGSVWSENGGWITVGNGNGPYGGFGGGGGFDPPFYGVNILTTSFMKGFAWGENIGWINFGTEPFIGADGARFDFAEGRLRGYAWSENEGWINLDDSTFYVSFEIGCSGDLSGDGVVDGADLAALLAVWGTNNAAADLNGDGTVDGADLASMLANWGDCS